MFGFHMPELIIILVVALLVFGPKKLPEMGASIGKSIKEFRKGMSELSQPKEEDETKHPNLEAIDREVASKKAAMENNPPITDYAATNSEVSRTSETKVD